ncbi:MAG: glycosyltransferase family 2 protein, partial [Nitrospiria bacterium]
MAYAVASRLHRGHWLVSLVYVAGLQLGAWWIMEHVGVQPPPAAWLVLPAVIGLTTVALAERWNAIAHACMAATVSVSILFLVYAGVVTVQAHLGPLSLSFAILLCAMQAFALVLLIANSYEVLDVTSRIRWTRIRRPEPTTAYFPKVSLHVPAYNEPPEMVKETLDALAKLDYPNYEVIVIDDNTTDE